jgi:hypothetical protein
MTVCALNASSMAQVCPMTGTIGAIYLGPPTPERSFL